MEIEKLNNDIKKAKIELVEIGKVIPYINNPRKKHNVDKVANSIKEFGFQQPIVVDKDFIVIVGHTRLDASKKLGLTHVPIQIADLNQTQANAYRIADNRLNQDAEWDNELLNIEISELLKLDFNTDIMGFESGELDKIMLLGKIKEDPNDFKEINESLKTKHICPSCGYEYD